MPVRRGRGGPQNKRKARTKFLAIAGEMPVEQLLHRRLRLLQKGAVAGHHLLRLGGQAGVTPGPAPLARLQHG